MNPILQRMGQAQMSQLGMLNGLKNQNPNVILQQLMSKNPQFKSFVEANKGKTPEQIARDYGVDINSLKGLLK